MLDVFGRHVAERGFERANFGDIAAELGISKGTIVHHFGTKSVLLRELQERYMRRRLAEAETLLDNTAGADEQLAALIYAFVNYQVVDRTSTVAFQREVVQLLDDETLATVRRQRADYRRLVRDVIRDGIDTGLFRRCDEDIVSLYIFGSVHWMWTWFDPDGHAPVDHIASEYVATTLRGLVIDDSRVERLSDPNGTIAELVRHTLEAANDNHAVQR
ncbi:TetR/AcrR family transcriptional regulator [Haloechinothrix sp. YIM 98757]|uniref:TetR/AcrR family transcriptional regulator n=1 Tax=Haloechinothrix aidingensis TaxID=2752311 RepID=A0A838AD71_9PSEU|nr:TetR/AcrR family transcriptional regulator [Haloechinothrix aidingensis]